MDVSGIPNFQAERERLSGIATAGWLLAFNYGWRGPEHMEVGYPAEWQREYEARHYAVGDPVVLWMLSRDEGHTRWSSIRIPDMRGVMKRAKVFGIVYGVIFTRMVGEKRSFLSMTRPDREFTDEEIQDYLARFNLWVDLVLNRGALTDGEIEILRCYRDGLGQAETAEALAISESTVKQRFAKIMVRLDAKTRTQAVALAVRRRYLDPS
ncbi:LuxR family transcriptional regulator [uncultured Brevundimonas sp.]|uniref:helix-turn-helix transcriptional regulator n=1 Tax=uncultured Brevundimonas sp. TaxID=213418 RepID=UPI0026177913|nr:LuxR family transcriptional regulator [uncultured Brevundimonas sp.]